MTKYKTDNDSTDRRTYLKLTGIAAGIGMFFSRFSGHAAAESGSYHELPGRIQAEDFDKDGEGVAYHDTNSMNEGDSYRPAEGVDIQPTDDESGEYNVGWIRDGEWLTYTVAIPAGMYNIHLHVASPSSDGDMRVLLHGTDSALLQLLIPVAGSHAVC